MQIRSIVQTRFLFTTVLAALILASLGASTAQDSEKNQVDHVMLVEPKQLQHYLKFPDSGFGDFYKLKISLCDKEGKNPQAYEDLYACSSMGDGPALVGSKRFSGISISEKTVLIVMKPSEKSTNETELRVAALAFAPLILDLKLMAPAGDDGKPKSNFAGTVQVPIGNFEAVKQGLASQGFQSGSQLSTPTTNLFQVILTSDPKGQYETMFYQPALKKKS